MKPTVNSLNYVHTNMFYSVLYNEVFMIAIGSFWVLFKSPVGTMVIKTKDNTTNTILYPRPLFISTDLSEYDDIIPADQALSDLIRPCISFCQLVHY